MQLEKGCIRVWDPLEVWDTKTKVEILQLESPPTLARYKDFGLTSAQRMSFLKKKNFQGDYKNLFTSAMKYKVFVTLWPWKMDSHTKATGTDRCVTYMHEVYVFPTA